MTEDLEIIEQGAENPVEEAPVTAADDMLSKSTVSKIVERERLKAFEKGKKEALMQLQQEQQSTTETQSAPAAAPQTLGGMPQLSTADIERMIAEKAPQLLQQALSTEISQATNRQMVDSFVSKMQAAEQRYPGLEQELNQLNYEDPRMHAFIAMANGLENTGDIMKEVIDNPHKLAQLLSQVKEQPYLAQKEMQKLSNSIKQNLEAQAQSSQTRDPLSQNKPSLSAGVDNGAMSVTDFRKMFRT